jgi:hypothetical protein
MGELATILVFCMAGLVLLQAVLSALAMAQLGNRLRRWADGLEASQAAVGRTLKVAAQMLSRVAQVSAYLPAIERQISRLLVHASNRLETWDQSFARGLTAATEGIESASRKFEYGLVQFSRQTAVIVRKIRMPALQLSALLKGVGAGLSYWRRGRQPAPLTDEESFI